MKHTVRAAALGLSLGAIVQCASAIGFGRPPANATIGQPLDLAIPLRLEPGETLSPECLSATVSFADNRQQPGTTSLRLDPARADAEERTLRVLTTTRVDEPVVFVEVTIGCSAQVSRQFTLFADPPLIVANAPAELPSAQAAAPEASAPAMLDSTPVPRASPPPAASRPRPPRRTAATQAPRRARPATPAPRSVDSPTRAAEGGSRLRLSPLEAGTSVAAVAEPSDPARAAQVADEAASANAAALREAASAASAAQAAAAAASARVAELEAGMRRARADAASAQAAIADLRDELRRTQSGLNSPALLNVLIAALVLMLLALAWLWRQRAQDREARDWLLYSGAEHARDGTPEGDAATAEAVAFSPDPAIAVRASLPPAYDDDEVTTPRGASVPTQWPVSMSGAAGDIERRREVSVEELIDLEQQAEFFVVLGQDEAAIDLLMGHLRSTAGTSPLPFLKLLEIYRRRGERKEYERMRERFNSRFSAVAPGWDTDLQGGRALEQYPEVIGRLQSLWPEPQRAMDVLQATLVRPVGPDGEVRGDDEGFDLPAYRELMLLYAVARDRSETEGGGGGGFGGETAVDLLLPLGGSDEPSQFGVYERLMATTSLEAQPSVRQPLTVDLTLDSRDTGPTTTAAALMHPSIDFDPSALPPLDEAPPKRRT